jgi:hypothetical protein
VVGLLALPFIAAAASPVVLPVTSRSMSPAESATAAPNPSGTPSTGLSTAPSTGSPTGSAAGSPTAVPTPTPSPTASPSAQDVAFLRAAHQDNLAEIQAGTAAEHRGSSAAARSLGARLVREHTSLDADLQRIATRLNLDMSTTPTATRQRQLEEVSIHTGKAFDRAWVATVTEWNTEALANDQGESRSGTLDDVKGLARDAVGVVRGHLSRLAKVPLDGPQVPIPTRTNTDDYAASQSPLVISVAAGMIIVGGAMLVLAGRAALFRRR